MNYRRTHNCGGLTAKNTGEKVLLAGWVHKQRDHGGLIFIDLRDRFGITQIVFHPDQNKKNHETASRLRSEWVIAIQGTVVTRAKGMINPKLKTGEVEVNASEIEILSRAETPPFSIADEATHVNEELRLKYRYLDLRRGEITNRLILRHHVVLTTRNFLSQNGFIEVMTPILAKSTPEGARDFLVPSRITPGTFYALPQSPQLFKQILMIGGLDRYFQIASCFRDEDLRADRQPEFSQIDLEMSFGSQEELFTIIEKLVAAIFKEGKGIELTLPFPRLPHKEAIENYGTDKPDLRFGMPLIRLDEIVSRSTATIFLDQLKMGGCVKGFCVKKGGEISRRQIDDYTQFVNRFGAHGLAWMKVEKEGLTSGVAKFFQPEIQNELIKKMEGEPGDLIFVVAGEEKIVNQSLDHLRRRVGNERGLIDKERYEFTWVTEFPLFGWDKETQNYICEHHPFTSPNEEDIALLDTDPLKVRSSSYDLVLNGYELGSGSQRIHDSDLQAKIFRLLKLTEEDIEKRFGFFIEALQYGTPPHMGIALGLDRIVMLLSHAESIRDVIAFPKTQKGTDLMLDAPSEVLKDQLTELKIHIGH